MRIALNSLVYQFLKTLHLRQAKAFLNGRCDDTNHSSSRYCHFITLIGIPNHSDEPCNNLIFHLCTLQMQFLLYIGKAMANKLQY